MKFHRSPVENRRCCVFMHTRFRTIQKINGIDFFMQFPNGYEDIIKFYEFLVQITHPIKIYEMQTHMVYLKCVFAV